MEENRLRVECKVISPTFLIEYFIRLYVIFFFSFVFLSPLHGKKRIQSLNGSVNDKTCPSTGFCAVRNNTERIDTATGT